jgi:hypothetical protein
VLCGLPACIFPAQMKVSIHHFLMVSKDLRLCLQTDVDNV